MQAVTELEARFKTALKNTNDGDEVAVKVKENQELLEKVDYLKTVRVNKDAKITQLRTRLADLQKTDSAAEGGITALQASLDKVEAEKNAALKQVNDLQEKIKNMGDSAVAGGTQEIEVLKGKLETFHAQREADITEVNAILDKLTPLVEGK